MLFFCSHGSLFIDLDRESLKVDEFVEDEDGISRETFIRMLMAKLTTTAHNITFKEIVSAFKLLDLDQTGMITNRSLGKRTCLELGGRGSRRPRVRIPGLESVLPF